MGKLRDILNGTAFKPHPQDIRVPIRIRLEGKNILYVRAMQRKLVLSALYFPLASGGFEVVEEISIDRGGDTRLAIRDFSMRHDTEYAVASTSPDLKLIESERDLPTSILEMQDRMNEDPKAIVGQMHDESLRYFPIRHPTMQMSLLFQFPQQKIEELVGEIESAGVAVCRVGSLPALGVHYFLDAMKSRLEAEDQLLFLVDAEGVFSVGVSSGELIQPKPRLNPKFQNIEHIAEFLKKEVQERAPARILYGDLSGSQKLDFESMARGAAEVPMTTIIENIFEAERPDLEVLFYG